MSRHIEAGISRYRDAVIVAQTMNAPNVAKKSTQTMRKMLVALLLG
jgi:hypothetical protein